MRCRSVLSVVGSMMALVMVMGGTVHAQGKPAAKRGGDAAKPDAKTPDVKPPSTAPVVPPALATPSNAGIKLKALEQRVNELKERIFRSKARLNLLKETVLHGQIAGSRAIIKHKNEMGSSYRLIRVVYAVDGARIYSKQSDDGSALKIEREVEVYNASVTPGNHTISVLMVFRGHGYWIFTYLKGYKFTVRASYTFTAGEGRQNVINARAFERGNMTTELKDRPAIKFTSTLFKVGRKGKK